MKKTGSKSHYIYNKLCFVMFVFVFFLLHLRRLCSHLRLRYCPTFSSSSSFSFSHDSITAGET